MHSLAKCIALVLILLGWAAVAQAVPVDLLKTPVPADVACGGAVDEAATLKAVQHWVLLCNNELSAIDKNDERRIMGYLLDMKVDYLISLQNSPVKEKITELVEPVLQRWMQQTFQIQMKKGSLTPADQKLLAYLGSLALAPTMEEGVTYLRLDHAAFYKHVHFSPAARAFVDVLVSQPMSDEDLGGEEYYKYWPHLRMAEWAAQLEKFLRTHAGNPYAPDALKRYHSIVDLMFFKRIPMRGPNGVIDRWNWQKNEILGPLAQTYQGTLTGRLIGDFIAAVDANGQKVPQGLKQRFAALIDAELAPKKSADVATAPAAQVSFYEGQGLINNKIPVALWFDSREGIVSGEIVYTATKARKPIRILGREEADGAFRLYEMLPNGDISGTITGTLTGGVLSGTWTGRPRMIEKSEGNYEVQRGKQFPITISAVKRTHAPYDWTFDAANASGTYAYSVGDKCDDGTVNLRINNDGTVRYRIIGLTGAPFYRTACFPEDALSDETAVAPLQGNRILIEEDAQCAIELRLYSDFLVSSYVDGKVCRHRVGDGATAEGLFLKRR